MEKETFAERNSQFLEPLLNKTIQAKFVDKSKLLAKYTGKIQQVKLRQAAFKKGEKTRDILDSDWVLGHEDIKYFIKQYPDLFPGAAIYYFSNNSIASHLECLDKSALFDNLVLFITSLFPANSNQFASLSIHRYLAKAVQGFLQTCDIS